MTQPLLTTEPADELESQLAEATDAYLELTQNGLQPDLHQFVARYPAIAGILKELLPAVETLQSHSVDPALPVVAESVEALGQLGDFRLLREIGRGGMGVVYEAEQISLNRRVALKVLSLAAAFDPRQLQRFRLEAQAAAHLHHGNIVPIYSVGCERGVYYYAMQFIEGRSLADVLAGPPRNIRGEAAVSGQSSVALTEGEATPSTQRSSLGKTDETVAEPRAYTLAGTTARCQSQVEGILRLGIQAADALEYAHSMGVVHRDVKPANLLLDATGKLYVADFGLAQLQGDPGVTVTGDLVGTLRYMSPEQARAQRGLVDHRTDIYSLGVTLYELLAGRPAFAAVDRTALLRQILEVDPPALRRCDPKIPLDVETIVGKAMAKEPERRYATAQDLADDLRSFLEHRPIRARRPSLLEYASKWARRHRTLVAASLALLCLSTIGFGVSTALIAREQWKAQAAYESESRQRALAEKNFAQARQIVDFLTETSEEELADKPELQDLRRTLLAASLRYYQDFIDQRGDDPNLQAELAASHLRVASILDAIGSRSDALAALDRARQTQEQLVRTRPGALEFQHGLHMIYHRSGWLRGGRELALLAQKAVQDDLKLSPEQVASVTRMWELRREAFRPGRTLTPEEWRTRFAELEQQESVLNALLTSEQSDRLGQIVLQQRGTEALTDPDVADELELTEDQRESLRVKQAEYRRLLWSLGPRPGEGRQDDWRRQDEMRRQAREQVLAVLTPEQRAEWQVMNGEPFKGKLRMPFRGGAGFKAGGRGARRH